MKNLSKSFKSLLTGSLLALTLLAAPSIHATTLYSTSGSRLGLFGDTYTFSSASASDIFTLNYSATGSMFFGASVTDTGFTTLYQLFGGSPPINQSFSLNPGTYAFTYLGGMLSGGTINDLSLSVSSVTAVPEASEWAMMLAGLGMIGFIVRRRANIQ